MSMGKLSRTTVVFLLGLYVVVFESSTNHIYYGISFHFVWFIRGYDSWYLNLTSINFNHGVPNCLLAQRHTIRLTASFSVMLITYRYVFICQFRQFMILVFFYIYILHVGRRQPLGDLFYVVWKLNTGYIHFERDLNFYILDSKMEKDFFRCDLEESFHYFFYFTLESVQWSVVPSSRDTCWYNSEKEHQSTACFIMFFVPDICYTYVMFYLWRL